MKTGGQNTARVFYPPGKGFPRRPETPATESAQVNDYVAGTRSALG